MPPSLAESVMGGAQDAQNQQGRTVGDAMQAYHIAATAEHARQELDMQKQDQQLKKSQYLLDGISRANTMTGPMQKEYLGQFTDQVKKMDPTIDTSGFGSMVKTPDDIQKILAGVKTMQDTGGVQTPEQASYVTNMFGFEGASKFISDYENHKAMVQAAQLKSEGQVIRGQNMQDNTVLGAVKHIHDAPEITQGVARGNAFDTDLQQLKANPTWQTYSEVMQNYGTSLTGMKGAISDAKLHELQASLRGPSQGKWATFATDNPGAAGNIADPKAVEWLMGKLGEVNKMNDIHMGSAARRRANVAAGVLHNPAVIPALNQTADMYQGGGWRQANPGAADASGGGGSQTPPPSPPPTNPTPYGTTPKEIEANYQAFLAQKAHQQAGGQ